MIRFLFGVLIGWMLASSTTRRSAAATQGGRVDELSSAARNPHPQPVTLNAGDGTPQRQTVETR